MGAPVGMGRGLSPNASVQLPCQPPRARPRGARPAAVHRSAPGHDRRTESGASRQGVVHPQSAMLRTIAAMRTAPRIPSTAREDCAPHVAGRGQQPRPGLGLQAPPVQVEVHLANGLPSFTLVGLADTEVKEARERVRAALSSSGLRLPAQQAHHRQPGAGRPAQGVGPLRPADRAGHPGRQRPDRRGRAGGLRVAGELSLAGELRPVRGALALALALRGRRRARAPWCCPRPAPPRPRWCRGVAVHARAHLPTWCALPAGDAPLEPLPEAGPAACRTRPAPTCRRARPGRRQARAGDRRGRRPQPAAGRARRAPASRCWRSACPACCRR
jgi:hypothetical protein